MARTRTRCPRLPGLAPAEHLGSDRADHECGGPQLVEAGYAEATQIPPRQARPLETLARGLLEFETLYGGEIKDLLLGGRPVRESVIEPTGPRSSAVPPAGKQRPRPDAADRRRGAAAAGVVRRKIR